MSRKQHNNEPGYIAERKNQITGMKNVIYIAELQDIDISKKYAIVCDKHSTIGESSNIPDARILMKSSEFCEECINGQKLES